MDDELTLSVLIDKLNDILSVDGDLPVYKDLGWGEFPVDVVTIQVPISQGDEELPLRVVLD